MQVLIHGYQKGMADSRKLARLFLLLFEEPTRKKQTPDKGLESCFIRGRIVNRQLILSTNLLKRWELGHVRAVKKVIKEMNGVLLQARREKKEETVWIIYLPVRAQGQKDHDRFPSA